MFLIGIFGGLIATIILFVTAEIASHRHNKVYTFMMGGLAFLVWGLTLTLLNVGGNAGLGSTTAPGLYEGIGWIAFAPDWVRLMQFAAAALLLTVALVLWVITHLAHVLSFGLRTRPYMQSRQTSDKSNVSAFRGKTLSQRLAKSQSGHEEKSNPIDIELPMGDDWRKAD